MQRRTFLLLPAGGVAGWSLAAHAQQQAMPVIGFLSPASPGPFASIVAAFRHGLVETGYVEGTNVAFEFRWAEGRYDRLPALAADLVDRKVDLIVTIVGTPPALAAKNATSTIPILFATVGDPVGSGLVASLARPGGNVTGLSNVTTELVPKLIELLSELVPHARVIALLVNPHNAAHGDLAKQAEEAARSKGVRLAVLKAGIESEMDTVFASFVQLQAGALVIGADPLFFALRDRLLALALRHAVPVIYWRRELVVSGGLISYGPSFPALYRTAGIYAGKILKGAKPADLPVAQPTKFELVINLKTAKALGLTVPQSLLAFADEVIE
jgi:putative ABC transport system substrate-binding protein